MAHQHPSARKSIVTVAGLVTIVALLALAGCGSDKKVTNPPGGGGTTTFKGTISGNGVSGALTLTVNTATPSPQFRARANVTMTGTLAITGGGTVALSGTYDDVAKTASVTGSGWAFTGGYGGSALEGTFAGPAGESGVFTVLTVGSGTDNVVVVIGTFTSTTGGPGGVWNTAIRGNGIHGNAWANGTTNPIPLDGTFTATGGGAGNISVVNPANPTGPQLATGTMAADGTASGAYDTGTGDSGTWDGQEYSPPPPPSACPKGTYILTPTLPAGANYTLEENYKFHSAEPNEGAGPGCCDVVYDTADANCIPVGPGVIGFDYYRNVPGATTCPKFFNSEVFKTVNNKVRFVLTGTWTTEQPLQVSGTYDAYNASNAAVESGTFTFAITFAVQPCVAP